MTVGPSSRCGAGKLNEAVGTRHGKIPQHERVKDTEDRSIGANPKREGQNGDRCECMRLTKNA
jgi:hypothetical protein